MIKRNNIHVNVFTSEKMVSVGLKTSDDVMAIIYPQIIEIELLMCMNKKLLYLKM